MLYYIWMVLVDDFYVVELANTNVVLGVVRLIYIGRNWKA